MFKTLTKHVCICHNRVTKSSKGFLGNDRKTYASQSIFLSAVMFPRLDRTNVFWSGIWKPYQLSLDFIVAIMLTPFCNPVCKGYTAIESARYIR